MPTTGSVCKECDPLNPAAKFDDVANPAHYCEGRTIEPRLAIIDWGASYCVGTAIAYLARAGRKGDAVTDLRKAVDYINAEITRLIK